jgi:uncharacterized cupredoxin-like copper-binding protein
MSTSSDDASLPAEAGDPEAERRQVAIETGWLLFGFGALATLPVFVANLILMPLKIDTFLTNPYLQAALATLVQVVIGYRFYRGAWLKLTQGSTNMDLLVAGGTTAAYLYSLYLFVAYGENYFESSMVILTLILLSKQLEAVAKVLSMALLAGAVALLLWYTQPFTTTTYAIAVTGPEFNLGEIHVKAGQQVRFRIENQDPQLDQMFGIQSIPARFVKQVESTPGRHGTMVGYDAMVHVEPGKRSVLQLTPTQPGRYPIGDPGIGIYGTLVVE